MTGFGNICNQKWLLCNGCGSNDSLRILRLCTLIDVNLSVCASIVHYKIINRLIRCWFWKYHFGLSFHSKIDVSKYSCWMTTVKWWICSLESEKNRMHIQKCSYQNQNGVSYTWTIIRDFWDIISYIPNKKMMKRQVEYLLQPKTI